MPRTRYVCGALRLVLVFRWIQLTLFGLISLACHARTPFLCIAECAYRICKFRLCMCVLCVNVLLCIRVVFFSELSHARCLFACFHVLRWPHTHHMQNGYTALMWAADKGQSSCVRLLLDAGANKDLKDNVRFRLPHCGFDLINQRVFLLVDFFVGRFVLGFELRVE
jgi:hypothetical protein